MLHLAGRHGADFALYKSIEFAGDAVRHLSMDSRFTMADHGIEVGAKFALFECDDRTRTLLAHQSAADFSPVAPDRDAAYAATLTVDVSELAPQVAAPHSFENNIPIADAVGVGIQQASIGSCANGRFEDVAIAAAILKGRRVSPGVRLLVSPASWHEYRKCIDAGLPQVLLDAGAQFINPGCGVCTKGAYLAPGETCISSTTRNHQGRMGSPQAQIYLASPATVAWSAVRGKIADPREVLT
jgi:3-isopropylmalate/(R)-2-methylmalate dehydratase large subunit